MLCRTGMAEIDHCASLALDPRNDEAYFQSLYIPTAT
jgi:hypothetical protein